MDAASLCVAAAARARMKEREKKERENRNFWVVASAPPSSLLQSMDTSTASDPSMSATATSIRTAKRALRKSMAQQLSLTVLPREEVLAQSQRVTARILASPTYKAAKSISVYVSMAQGEVDTDAICRRVLVEGKKLYVPLFATPAPAPPKSTPESQRLEPNPPSQPVASSFAPDMRMLRIISLADYEGMKLNKWGIREPLETVLDDESHASRAGESPVAPRKREDALDSSTGGQGLDLILAPGVAFDISAGRLGHGKGYYDRYLSRAEQWAEKHGLPGPVCVALGLSQQVLPTHERVPADENDRILDGIVTPEGVLRRNQQQASRWVDG
ncbi:unnamed protein product [Jaminaea pallidilutea]